MKPQTRSDTRLNYVTRFDDIDVSKNETSSSIVVSSNLNPFHQYMVKCCKTLPKSSDESNKSIVALETQPCSTLGFEECDIVGQPVHPGFNL